MAASHSPDICSGPIQRNSKSSKTEDHHMNAINNNVLRMSPRRQASMFAEWFRKLVDSDRSNLSLYLSNDAVMQWFGRTIKTKKKITGFLKYDMHFTNHRFTSVEACGPISVRGEKETQKKNVSKDDDEDLALPLEGVTPLPCRRNAPQREASSKRRRAFSSSPESPTSHNFIKRSRTTQSPQDMEEDHQMKIKSPILESNDTRKVGSKLKKVDELITVLEEGQGDCLPSTSGTKNKIPRANEQSIDYVTQLPRCYIEIRCVIDFTKTRNKRGAELMKWERQCKLQIAYTEDPVYAGEYIIWTIIYSDNNKCRRNLLAAFEAVSLEQEKNQSSL